MEKEIWLFAFLIYVFIMTSNVHAESVYPCCCSTYNKCVMGSGEDIGATECRDACRGISYGAYPNSWCGDESYCVSLGEWEETPEEEIPVEICNGVDDDGDDMVDEDDSSCVNSTCLAEEYCPLGYVCSNNEINFLGLMGNVIWEML